ncbi:unnamed protein product [Tenebrio molitor]|nr:unnamed protein product [Tenebrio molitor]
MDAYEGPESNFCRDTPFAEEILEPSFAEEVLEADFGDDGRMGTGLWSPMGVIELIPHYGLEDKTCQIIYDCMWNGGHNPRGAHEEQCYKVGAGSSPGDASAPVVQVGSSQQSLLKRDAKLIVDPNAVVPMTPFNSLLQTPPISDDEDTKPTPILQSLVSALSENELDDGELSDYFRGDDGNWMVFDDKIDEEEEEDALEDDERETEEARSQRQQVEMRAFYAANDHSYHKGSYTAAHSDSLGIDTPSDSEEEIDVVSLGDKFSVSKVVAGALPTNPSTKDRRQLQMTMESCFPRGLKTIMPVKRVAAPGPTKKAPENRGRARQYKRVKQNQRQYKKRNNYGPSSDSEPEPLEKRHLHNNMERQRRIDLRNLFNDLKKLVPEVNKKQRAAKVLILRGAAQYCEDLSKTSDVLGMRVEHLRQKQARLRAQLSKLRRDWASKR